METTWAISTVAMGQVLCPTCTIFFDQNYRYSIPIRRKFRYRIIHFVEEKTQNLNRDVGMVELTRATEWAGLS